MKYTELLNDEDIQYICKAISGKNFKKIFADSPKEFTRIKPGFRPNSMSDEEAVEIAIKNFNKEFVRGFVEVMIKQWLKEIEANFESLQMEDYDYEDAVALTLLDSYFAENVKLYFKLAQAEKDDAYILYICNKMVSAAQEQKKDGLSRRREEIDNTELVSKIQDLSVKNEELEKQKVDAENQINALDEEKKNINAQLYECQKKLEELQGEYQQDMLELKDLRERAQNEIIVDEENFTSDEYDFISLCEVLPPDYNGIELIERYADLTRDGEFEEFYCDESEPTTFENRDKLYWKEGPCEVGTMGVWMWRAVPNNTNPNKDYIYSRFASELKPIEMISIHQVSDEKNLLDLLKDGLEIEHLPEMGMYSANVGKGHYSGFLCASKDFEKNGDKFRLKSTLITLPKYEFGRNEFIKFDNNRRFFKKLSVGMPDALVPVKDTMELIKNIILGRNSWSVFKEAGKSRGEWKLVKNFLDELDVNSICAEIADTLSCSQVEAKKQLDEFITVAVQYIDGDSIEDSIIEAIIVTDDRLMTKCKKILKNDWEEENKKEIAQKQKEIDLLNIELAKGKEQLDEICSDKEKYEGEVQNFRKELEAKEQLAEDVEKEVSKRIREAQGNAAAFIAEMAFVNVPSRLESQMEDKNQINEITLDASENIGIFTQIKEDIDEDWNMTLDSIEDELIEAGVMATFARPMAAYLYSAYLIGSDLLLTGPNAEAIAQAFSCAVTGKLTQKLQYKNAPNLEYYKNQIHKGTIVIIEEPFNAEWVSQIPNFVANTEAFCIGIHPFIEDLQIEPRSYFNYMLPVFTDSVVDRAPAKSYMCSLKADNYVEYEYALDKKDNSKALSILHVPAIAKKRLELIVGNMHLMLGDSNTDYDVMFALLPYAYSTMQTQLLNEMIKDSNKKKITISNTMLKYLTEIYGEFDE